MSNNKNSISGEMLDYVGILSKLEFEEKERKDYIKGMEEMLDYVDILNELDTSNVSIDGDFTGNCLSSDDNVGNDTYDGVLKGNASFSSDDKNVFREDEVFVSAGSGQEAALLNAPVKKGECIVVPKTI